MPPPSRFARPKVAAEALVALQGSNWEHDDTAFVRFALDASGEITDRAAFSAAFGIEIDVAEFFTTTHRPVVGGLTHGTRYLVRGPERLGDAAARREIIFGCDEVMLAHAPLVDRVPENPQRLRRAITALEGCGFKPLTCAQVGAHRAATLPEIAAVHDEALYRDFVVEGRSLSERIPLPTDVYCSESTSSAAALMACGLCIDVVKCLIAAHRAQREKSSGDDIESEPPAGFCLVRPPGHHCSHSAPSGFCLINNIVVASRAAQRDCGIRRVAIIDIDVHHGDGTQSLVGGDASILFASLHRHDGGRFFPHTGAAGDLGGGNCLNVPCDTSPADPTTCYRTISDFTFDAFFESVVSPAVTAFKAELILVSCGFDAADGDPLGGMGVVNGYARMALHLRALARAVDAPLCFVLEGGYHLDNVARNTVAVAEALSCVDAESAARMLSTIPCQPPQQWSRLRAKQAEAQRHWAQALKCDGERGGDTHGAEDAPPAPSMTQPTQVPPTEELARLHHEWVRATVHSATETHKVHRQQPQ